MTGRPAVSGLARAWDEVLGEHDRVGSPLRRFLRPGGPAGEVEAGLLAHGVTPLPSLVWWHQQVPGVDQAAYEAVRGHRVALGLFPGGYSLTLDQAADTQVEFREQAERLEQWTERHWRADEYWKTSWWPIMSAEPATIVIDADESVVRVEWSAERGPVVDVLCPSLLAFLEAIAEAFHAGTYNWNEDAGLLRMSDPTVSPTPPSCKS